MKSFFFNLENSINMNSMFIVQIIIIALTCGILIGRVFFGFFKRLLPFDSTPFIGTPKTENETPRVEKIGFNFNKIRSKLFPSIQYDKSISSDINLQSIFIPYFLRSFSIENFAKNETNSSKQNE